MYVDFQMNKLTHTQKKEISLAPPLPLRPTRERCNTKYMSMHILSFTRVTSSVSDCWLEPHERSSWRLSKGSCWVTVSQAFTFRSVTCSFHSFFFLPQCLAGVQEAFAAVEKALTGGNASQVAADFHCCQTPKSLDDQVRAL